MYAAEERACHERTIAVCAASLSHWADAVVKARCSAVLPLPTNVPGIRTARASSGRLSAVDSNSKYILEVQ